MRSYIIRRLLLLIPTLFLVTLIIFLLIQLVPGEAVELLLSQGQFEVTDMEAIKEAMGVDVPIHIQYIRWMGGVLRGDLGNSLWTGKPVLSELIPKLPVSLELGIIGIIVSLMIALPIGIYSAIRQDTMGDYMGRSFAIGCIAIPNFWIGTMIMVFPAIWWGWTPSLTYIPFVEDPLGNLCQFIVPGLVLGMTLSGVTMRMTRTMMLEVMRQDFIRTAWAKGLRERTVIIRHALKNALIPIVTIVGLMVPVMIGGMVVIEQIFCLPGTGRYLLEAIQHRDYIAIAGINVIIASFVVLVNLVVDLIYSYLDPRISYG